MKIRRAFCFIFGPCGQVELVQAASSDSVIAILFGRCYCKGCGREIVG